MLLGAGGRMLNDGFRVRAARNSGKAKASVFPQPRMSQGVPTRLILPQTCLFSEERAGVRGFKR